MRHLHLDNYWYALVPAITDQMRRAGLLAQSLCCQLLTRSPDPAPSRVPWQATHGCHWPSQRGSQHWIGSSHSCRYHSPPQCEQCSSSYSSPVVVGRCR